MKHQTSPNRAAKDQLPAVPNTDSGVDLAERCRTQISPTLQELLHIAAHTADTHAVRVYAVGGFVRMSCSGCAMRTSISPLKGMA